MLRVHYRPPEMLPPHQRDFPPRDTPTDHLHVGDTRFLLLMVAGYVLAMIGGIILLHAFSPVTHATLHIMDTADVKISGR